MLAWITENMGTILVCAFLVLIVGAVIMSLLRDRKKGKSSCGYSCAHCAMNGACHSHK